MLLPRIILRAFLVQICRSSLRPEERGHPCLLLQPRRPAQRSEVTARSHPAGIQTDPGKTGPEPAILTTVHGPITLALGTLCPLIKRRPCSQAQDGADEAAVPQLLQLSICAAGRVPAGLPCAPQLTGLQEEGLPAEGRRAGRDGAMAGACRPCPL